MLVLVSAYNFSFLKLVFCQYLTSHSLVKNTKLTFHMDGLTFVLDYARHKGDIRVLHRVPRFRIIESKRKKKER